VLGLHWSGDAVMPRSWPELMASGFGRDFKGVAPAPVHQACWHPVGCLSCEHCGFLASGSVVMAAYKKHLRALRDLRARVRARERARHELKTCGHACAICRRTAGPL